MHAATARGPLILGASGRIGRGFRALWSEGHWPSQDQPLWHGRHDAELAWDMDGPLPPPGFGRGARGVIVLSGVTAGDAAALDRNRPLALAALALARREGLGPVLFCSTSQVYGAGPGPHAESAPTRPVTAYGRAKLAMEDGVGPAPGVCCLRIANVAGADQLLLAAAGGRVRLDRFADGRAPVRTYIGPLSLARAMLALLAAGPLPPVLNLAQPGPVGMDSLLAAAGCGWDWQPAPATAVPRLELDTARLAGLVTLPPADPGTLIAEARAAGWGPAR